MEFAFQLMPAYPQLCGYAGAVYKAKRPKLQH